MKLPTQYHLPLHNVPRHIRLWVALSGGLDSKVLLHRLAKEVTLHRRAQWSLSAVHLRHHLETDEPIWQSDCERFCNKLEVPLYIMDAPAPHQSSQGMEAAARHARLAAWKKLAVSKLKEEPQNYASSTLWLALGHHANDRAETIIHRIGRGAGTKGLAVMPAISYFPINKNEQQENTLALFRPMLDWPKSAIEAYAIEHDILGADDPANHDLGRTRTHLRKTILPTLLTTFPAFLDRAKELSTIAEMEHRLLQEFAQIVTKDCIDSEGKLLRKPLLALDKAKQMLVFRYWLAEQLSLRASSHYSAPSFKRLHHLLAMLFAKPQGAVTPIPSLTSVQLCWTRETITLTTTQGKSTTD